MEGLCFLVSREVSLVVPSFFSGRVVSWALVEVGFVPLAAVGFDFQFVVGDENEYFVERVVAVAVADGEQGIVNLAKEGERTLQAWVLLVWTTYEPLVEFEVGGVVGLVGFATS